MRWMFVLAFVLFATSTVLAQEEAYTTDGRKVILFENGKWKDAETDPHFRQAFWGCFLASLPQSRERKSTFRGGTTGVFQQSVAVAVLIRWRRTAS